MNMRHWVTGAMLWCVTGAVAGPFTFTQVSNSNDGFLDDYVAPAYNDNGEVAFWGSYSATADAGIFTADAPAFGALGPLNTVVDSSGVYSSFTHGQVDINNNGELSFYANLDGGGAGIFYYDGSVATNVFATGTNWSDMGTSLSVGHFPQLNDSGQLTFTSQFPVDSAAFLWDGGTVTEIARGGSTPGLGFNGFAHHVDINNSGLMLAQSQSGGWQTLVAMTTAGTDRWINDGINPNPSGFGYFSHIGTTPVLNNNGLAAFSAKQSFASTTGLYLTDSASITQIYIPLAGHSLNETFSINDNGTVLYVDQAGGGTTLFAYQNGVTTEILKSGDLIEGKIVDQIQISTNALNNNDELAIYANFFDGSSGVYVAGLSAIPEPASIFLLCGGTLAIWRRRRKMA